MPLNISCIIIYFHSFNLFSFNSAVDQRKEFVCIWKLLGDILSFLSKLPEKYCSAIVSDPLIENETQIRVQKEKLYEIATR